MRALVLIFFINLLLLSPVQASTSQLLQLIDYIGVDYAGAVQDGKLLNPDEYAEMLDFANGVKLQLDDLPDHPIKKELAQQARQLLMLVKNKQSADKVKQLTSQMHAQIVKAYNITVIPRKQPDLQQAKELYQQNCVACHGEQGLGNGVLAKTLEPKPTNFHDLERYRQRTLFGLHNTITQGVADTAMKGFDHLSDDERWSLAFYVGGWLLQHSSKSLIFQPPCRCWI